MPPTSCVRIMQDPISGHQDAADAQDRKGADMIALLRPPRRFALGHAGAANQADDLVQTTVEKTLRNAWRTSSDMQLDAWMFRILRNNRIDGLRARRDTVELDAEAAKSLASKEGRDDRGPAGVAACAAGLGAVARRGARRLDAGLRREDALARGGRGLLAWPNGHTCRSDRNARGRTACTLTSPSRRPAGIRPPVR